jgi:hypothetical protein
MGWGQKSERGKGNVILKVHMLSPEEYLGNRQPICQL